MRHTKTVPQNRHRQTKRLFAFYQPDEAKESRFIQHINRISELFGTPCCHHQAAGVFLILLHSLVFQSLKYALQATARPFS
jgi:hypothetical protein